MRLIDADKLINQGYEIVVDGLQYDTCNKSIDIDAITTAYSVDTVIEDVRCRCYEMGLDESQTEIIVSEIVKQGGVSDDVCECKLLKGYNFLHKTSCGDVFDMENGFKYCPYCGKKIKIVGD